jgi:GT2 family glycosyltransferase
VRVQSLPSSDARTAPTIPRADYSVVIPTRNRPQLVGRLLAALRTQSRPPKEVIVVDQSLAPSALPSSQQALGGEGTESRLIYLHDPKIEGAAAARNAGLLLATTPYVIFLDDDALPQADCLELLVDSLERHPHLVAVGGLISNYSPPPWPVRFFRRFFYLGRLRDERQAWYWRASESRTGDLLPTTKLNGGCMAFRREILLEIGGFDRRYCGASVGEDVEITQRLIRHTGRTDAVALVGGALIHHASEGAWKNNDRAIELELLATHYWFKRNVPWNLANRFRFLWMCLGLFLWSAASAARRRKVAPVLRFLAGLDSIRHDYRGCPFLKPQQPPNRAQPAP